MEIIELLVKDLIPYDKNPQKQKRAKERNKRKKRLNKQIIVTDRKSCEEYWETIGQHLNKEGRVKLLAEKDLIEVKENEL